MADAERGARALRAVGKVRGVKHVDHALRVGPPHEPDLAPPSPSEAADALLEARVKTRLLRDLGPRAFLLAVEANQGKVTLGGRIPSRDD